MFFFNGIAKVMRNMNKTKYHNADVVHKITNT
jgi:hypothetical protein